MTTTKFRLRKNSDYNLKFAVPEAGTHTVRADDGGTLSDISGWNITKSGGSLNVSIPAGSYSFPENIAIVDSGTGAVLHRAKINWGRGPEASVPVDGSVTLEKLAFDPQTQAEANTAASTEAANNAAIEAKVADATRRQPNVQTAAYTLALGDEGNVVEVDSATAVTVTVPDDATVAFPVGAVVALRMLGAGPITVAAAVGVTIRSAGGALRITAQFGEATLTKRAANDWILAGNIAV